MKKKLISSLISLIFLSLLSGCSNKSHMEAKQDLMKEQAMGSLRQQEQQRLEEEQRLLWEEMKK
ncbi:MAG: hypothetical protein JWM09_615 [Francisellaceae bacterium]|nr:hypothetical protein [Francisellaceae bacterium]